MAHSVRTALSLDKEDFQHLELLRKKLDKSRSELIQEAIHDLFHKLETEKLESRYAEGYRKKPEIAAEVTAMLKASLPSFPKESW
jgi:metal-responsive CopG/Arc/MetJ family transcriptional regulator